jgi:hypothetical protein
MLQQEQQNREAAGVGGKPVSMPIPAFQSNIPTLSSAQFAALVGAHAANPALAEPEDGAAADPQSVSRVTAPTAAAQATAMPAATAMRLTGRPAPPTGAPAPAGSDAADEDAPSFARVGEPTLMASAATGPATGPTGATDAAASDGAAATQAATGQDPTAADAAKVPPPDPNVVHLKDAPDRETQRNLMAQHKRWIVDETPGSRQLFFGPDGKFGWDDFLDVINPLQHIPIVAQIYRAVTGDKIYGAAELIGSLPFGPLGMVGTMATVADLAVKDTTGKDMGENLEAMVFGGPDKKNPDGSAADSSDTAEATPVHPDLGMQSASAESSMDAERQAHDQRKA